MVNTDQTPNETLLLFSSLSWLCANFKFYDVQVLQNKLLFDLVTRIFLGNDCLTSLDIVAHACPIINDLRFSISNFCYY